MDFFGIVTKTRMSAMKESLDSKSVSENFEAPWLSHWKSTVDPSLKLSKVNKF